MKLLHYLKISQEDFIQRYASWFLLCKRDEGTSNLGTTTDVRRLNLHASYEP
ncbi:hypothetical protein Sjap_006297 [Stephania japonica]|uniref:Uncharacterized protein n=1 Tax=Stephania japonica TaxID=461633 RepID=A0AAP0PKX4_9MAGN